MAAVAFAVLLVAGTVGLNAQQSTGAAVRIDNDDIGGVVASANGPEAGVWVIAETTDLPTKFAKIVVTDDQGRYVLPDLPKAHYNIWVRGYGLVDSRKCAAPGRFSAESVMAPTGGSGGILSGYPLVLHAQDSGQERAPAGKARLRTTGWPASNPTAAYRVTNWATSRRARFPRSWAGSVPLWRRGSGASFPDKPAK
jgi:hypothetical protein